MSVDEVVEEVLKDEIFYINSGGGVTLSGGEPLAQADFSAAILSRCKEKGLHTAIETAGHIGWSQVEKIIPYTDLFLYDLKHMDPRMHKAHVGADNSLILTNLERLSKESVGVIVRTPVIPGFNDCIPHIRAIARHAAMLGIPELHLLPYHGYGASKYRGLGRRYDFHGERKLDKEEMEELRKVAAAEGLDVVVGG
jgi:pyruvate formate lyase activating enzyme